MATRSIDPPSSGAHGVLDVPQEFEEATSYQVRDELQDLLARDLLGPWDGEHEQFAPRATGPRDRYLVGMLGPKRAPRPTEAFYGEAPDLDLGGEGDATDGELPDRQTLQNAGRIWASSMGLSFAVLPEVDVVHVTAGWGRYQTVEIETEEGVKRRVWTREPVTRTPEVRLDGKRSTRLRLDADPPDYRPLDTDQYDEPGIFLDVHVRHASGQAKVVELTLINAQDEPVARKDTAWIFQPRLVVRALDGSSPIFQPIDDPLMGMEAVAGDPEEQHLRLLYCDELRYANGRNVAVHAEVADGQRCAHELRTTWLPVYDVPATAAPSVDESPHLADLQLSMDTLAELDPDALGAALRPLAHGYADWLYEQALEIPTLPAALRPTAEAALFDARRVAERIGDGIELLRGDETALDAFRFANRAMALQRRNTILTGLRDAGGLSYDEARQRVTVLGASGASWRPFQLAFVLLNLPALTEPTHPERAANAEAVVDLLFFPTGGGKTEAYLGLAAYTFAIRRLQGVVGAGADARSGEDGTAVLMRYTLRLLTAQQFQRAAALVCAAEVLRREAVEGGDPRWGERPFRIGLWVGSAVSPYFYEEAAKQVVDARQAGHDRHAKVLQVLTCPWCGESLRAHQDMREDEVRRRILVYCPRGEGLAACPFSRRRAEGEGLPILTVDEEIYLVPSLLIATVDKLAQLPWRGYAGMLFGRVQRWCPRHGYRHDDLDARTGCGDSHHAKGRLPKVATQPVTRLRPPDLIIQDELHLISGALGTVVGLFESAVDHLCTWNAPDGPGGTTEAGPKIVASTATTKRAREQVRGIFARQLAIFPPPVLHISDNFFSRQLPRTERTPGRRYLGICAHGVRLKAAEIRLAEILLVAGQTLFDRYGTAADPYMTLVSYFNSTRELAGMRRYLDDDVTTRVRFNGSRKGLSDRITPINPMLAIQELTSRINSGEIADALKRLDVGFDPELDTSTCRQARLAEFQAARQEKRSPRVPDRDAGRLPVDVVLATSMLQVGVDIARFGLMVVTGQPKNTAEYIQASSRVGREASRPGLVVTLYNWSRPRDLAHYEDFEHYHATFYRQVEALSVTPYARRALDRGAAAAYVAAVRNAREDHSRNADAHDVDLDGETASRVTERFLARADAVDPQRGRSYLSERLNTLSDRWKQARQGSARLGYERKGSGSQPLVGLLDSAGGGAWSALAVARSMRETENELNLLLPGSGLFDPAVNESNWSFTAPAQDTGEDADSDELGAARSGDGQGERDE